MMLTYYKSIVLYNYKYIVACYYKSIVLYKCKYMVFHMQITLALSSMYVGFFRA